MTTRAFTKISPKVRASSEPTPLALKMERSKSKHHGAIGRKVSAGALNSLLQEKDHLHAKAMAKWRETAGQEPRPVQPKPLFSAEEKDEMRAAVHRRRARQFVLASMDLSRGQD